jgi:hypothetical protein
VPGAEEADSERLKAEAVEGTLDEELDVGISPEVGRLGVITELLSLAETGPTTVEDEVEVSEETYPEDDTGLSVVLGVLELEVATAPTVDPVGLTEPGADGGADKVGTEELDGADGTSEPPYGTPVEGVGDMKIASTVVEVAPEMEAEVAGTTEAVELSTGQVVVLREEVTVT